jgi:hypothetical protein
MEGIRRIGPRRRGASPVKPAKWPSPGQHPSMSRLPPRGRVPAARSFVIRFPAVGFPPTSRRIGSGPSVLPAPADPIFDSLKGKNPPVRKFSDRSGHRRIVQPENFWKSRASHSTVHGKTCKARDKHDMTRDNCSYPRICCARAPGSFSRFGALSRKRASGPSAFGGTFCPRRSNAAVFSLGIGAHGKPIDRMRTLDRLGRTAHRTSKRVQVRPRNQRSGNEDLNSRDLNHETLHNKGLGNEDMVVSSARPSWTVFNGIVSARATLGERVFEESAAPEKRSRRRGAASKASARSRRCSAPPVPAKRNPAKRNPAEILATEAFATEAPSKPTIHCPDGIPWPGFRASRPLSPLMTPAACRCRPLPLPLYPIRTFEDGGPAHVGSERVTHAEQNAHRCISPGRNPGGRPSR